MQRVACPIRRVVYSSAKAGSATIVTRNKNLFLKEYDKWGRKEHAVDH
jgi:hypothetical protein